jgi:SAM-dependent methyltransferase
VTRIYGEEAELYDIAFDWDVDDEVDWLLERLGSPVSVLEPGCGSGRMLEALVRRGVDAVGIDLSPEMLAIAERRAPGRLRAHLRLGGHARPRAAPGDLCGREP